MIKTFIFVEDGSVDLDELKNSVGDDVLVVPYRQGAASPEIRQPREPVSRREVNIKDRLLDLMIEFDEMGFAPTTVCEDAEGLAVKWKEQVVNEIGRLETQITTLQEGLKKAVEDVAERIKMALFCELADDMSFKMASKIEKAIKEACDAGETAGD